MPGEVHCCRNAGRSSFTSFILQGLSSVVIIVVPVLLCHNGDDFSLQLVTISLCPRYPAYTQQAAIVSLLSLDMPCQCGYLFWP